MATPTLVTLGGPCQLSLCWGIQTWVRSGPRTREPPAAVTLKILVSGLCLVAAQ